MKCAILLACESITVERWRDEDEVPTGSRSLKLVQAATCRELFLPFIPRAIWKTPGRSLPRPGEGGNGNHQNDGNHDVQGKRLYAIKSWWESINTKHRAYLFSGVPLASGRQLLSIQVSYLHQALHLSYRHYHNFCPGARSTIIKSQ